MSTTRNSPPFKSCRDLLHQLRLQLRDSQRPQPARSTPYYRTLTTPTHQTSARFPTSSALDCITRSRPGTMLGSRHRSYSYLVLATRIYHLAESPRGVHRLLLRHDDHRSIASLRAVRRLHQHYLCLLHPATGYTAIGYISGPTLIGASWRPTLTSGWKMTATADFNSDGNPDYLLYKAGTHQTAIWYLNNNVFVSSA